MVVQQARSGAKDNANWTTEETATPATPARKPPQPATGSPAVNKDKGSLRPQKLQYDALIHGKTFPKKIKSPELEKLSRAAPVIARTFAV